LICPNPAFERDAPKAVRPAILTVVHLARENTNKVFVTETEGCTKETVAKKSVDPKFFINILSGGVFGSTTDYAAEKMWKYAENVVISCKK